jgi:hypothetical protein
MIPNQNDTRESIIKEKKKKISDRNQLIEFETQPRIILRRKLHTQLNNIDLKYMLFPCNIYKNPQFKFVTIITNDENKSEIQSEFIDNLINYTKKHHTNIWIYKPEKDQVSTYIDTLGYLKANLLLKHLDNSYLIWIDQDYLILDHNKSMMDIITQYPDKSLIMFYNDYAIRMDFMIWKMDNWSVNVLNHLRMRKYLNQEPTKIFLEILSHDRENKHILVPLQVLINNNKQWIKSYYKLSIQDQLNEMKKANAFLHII